MNKKNIFPRSNATILPLLLAISSTAPLLLLISRTTHCRLLITPLDQTYLYLPYIINTIDRPTFSLFGQAHHRHATSAFFEKNTRSALSLATENNNPDTSTQQTCLPEKNCCDASLAQLMLNHASPNIGSHIFKAKNSCLFTDKNTFYLQNLCGAVTYKENDIELTAQYARPINNKRQWGLRTTLPIKKIVVSVKNNTGTHNNRSSTNKCCAHNNKCDKDIVGVKKDGQFAYRLDALSTYALSDKLDPRDGPLMQYGTIEESKPITFERDGLKIPLRDRVILNTHLSSEDLSDVSNSAHVIKSCGVPPFPFGSQDTSSFIPLDGDGDNLSTGQRGKFQPKPIEYRQLKKEPITQSTLWVVPTLTDTGELTRGADIIDTHVSALLQLFTHNSLDTCSNSVSGVGDLALESYIVFYPKKLFLELLLGITLPTGRKKDPLAVFELPTGTNGHAQLNTGYTCFCPLTDWCTFFNNGRYAIILPRTENILASFSTVGIRNIGECAKARIWWQEYTAVFAFSFHEKKSHRYGVTAKYQFFAKEKDHIEFKQLTTNDCALETELCNPHRFKASNPQEFKDIIVSEFFSRNKKLNGHQASYKSSMITHTLSGELFWRITSHINLFFQAGHTVGGKNSPKITTVFGGMSGEF